METREKMEIRKDQWIQVNEQSMNLNSKRPWEETIMAGRIPMDPVYILTRSPIQGHQVPGGGSRNSNSIGNTNLSNDTISLY